MNTAFATVHSLGEEKLPATRMSLEYYAMQMISRRRKLNANNNTTSTYESHIRAHIVPFAGDRHANTLLRRDSMAFVDYLLDKSSVRSPCTVVQIFKTWRVLVNYMVDRDVPLPANVVARIELPKVEDRVKIPLTTAQVSAVATAIRAVEPRYEILVWLGACAGLRAGEAFGLKCARVKWTEDRLYVVEQRQRGKAVKLKTKASYATLPVDHFLVLRLAEHVSRFSGHDPMADDTKHQYRTGDRLDPLDEGLIVTNRFGRPVQRSEFNEKWRRAAQLAGLPEGTRFHDLKHFYTSILGASGRHDPKTVQALSRHAEFSETWDTYAHPPLAAEGVKVTTFASAFAFSAGMPRP